MHACVYTVCVHKGYFTLMDVQSPPSLHESVGGGGRRRGGGGKTDMTLNETKKNLEGFECLNFREGNSHKNDMSIKNLSTPCTLAVPVRT